MAVDLSGPKKLDADPNVLQQTEFLKKYKTVDSVNDDVVQPMPVLTNFKNLKKKKTKILSRKCSSL